MINNLKLKNFKAFRDEANLDLGGKNVLIYGENGAGKSSLYQALKIIFHEDKIFEAQIAPTVTDPMDRQNAEKDVLGQYNYQKTPLTDFTLEIDGQDYTAYSTAGYDVSMISREDIQAEDVIDVVKLLKDSFVGIADPQKFVEEKKETIEQLVNSFLKDYFYEDNLTVELTYSRPNWFLTVKDASRDNRGRYERLTEYFNEAKIHIIKLLLLLTSVLYNGAAERGEKKVLVLDDVISSMDAVNRTFFVELLKEYFDDYQKIILTHSVSFFNMADYAFSIAYRQKGRWKQFQIVEHEGNSQICERSSQDYASIISKERKKYPIRDIGNRIRKRFEFLVCEVSKLLHTGGIAESGKLIEAINTPKKLYYKYDAANKKTNTVYDLIEELTVIIDADDGSALKANLEAVINDYVSDTEVAKLRDTICDLAVYQKVSMHPLSHATGAMPLSTQKEVERSITLLMMLEKQIGALVGRDLYSI